ncbi:MULTISPECIES: YeeE/YedE family protein [Methylomicrobium]|uniref:Putative transporter component n=1 Tax=Methylomicrobium album BG8 TaxID=686340 RepID=H8GK42_METAL|nr:MULTISPECIES: YeeE/YedE family protein [Methylomicrobium]EIC29166.1 putative transporter component [Methylomicrobium album BG8]
MENFTPYSALAGGALIGIASAMLLFFNGRIAGISGIMNGVFFAPKNDRTWRLLFLAGLVAGGGLLQWLVPGFNVPRQGYPAELLAIGGFLVGVGTRIANGCVSGHGVCGIARLSIRSIAATLTFIAAGMLTVYVIRHLSELTA